VPRPGGGLARLVASEAKAIEETDELLTLKGLKILFDRNPGGGVAAAAGSAS
jgi:hypothetical protein